MGDKSNRSTPTKIQLNQGGNNGGGVSSSDTHTLVGKKDIVKGGWDSR